MIIILMQPTLTKIIISTIVIVWRIIAVKINNCMLLLLILIFFFYLIVFIYQVDKIFNLPISCYYYYYYYNNNSEEKSSSSLDKSQSNSKITEITNISTSMEGNRKLLK